MSCLCWWHVHVSSYPPNMSWRAPDGHNSSSTRPCTALMLRNPPVKKQRLADQTFWKSRSPMERATVRGGNKWHKNLPLFFSKGECEIETWPVFEHPIEDHTLNCQLCRKRMEKTYLQTGRDTTPSQVKRAMPMWIQVKLVGRDSKTIRWWNTLEGIIAGFCGKICAIRELFLQHNAKTYCTCWTVKSLANIRHICWSECYVNPWNLRTEQITWLILGVFMTNPAFITPW